MPPPPPAVIGAPTRTLLSRPSAPPPAPTQPPVEPSARAFDRNLISVLGAAVREAELAIEEALGAPIAAAGAVAAPPTARALAAAAPVLRGTFTALADEVPELRARAAFWLQWARLEEAALRDASSAMDVLSAGLVACR